MVYNDACTTATITPKVISDATVTWLVDTSFDILVSAFTDSASTTYGAGTCGTYTFTIDPPVNFLTVSQAVSSSSGPVITYTEASATASDIGSHTVTYTVQMDDYVGISLTG